MNQQFHGWGAVADRLRRCADLQQSLAKEKGETAARLNEGQQASLRAIADRIGQNGVVIADEVGMGKTRIAVELARCVVESGGRVAILVPPGLGYQWQAELREGRLENVPPILRSLGAYYAAWDPKEPDQQQPWFEKSAVVISHAFTNWRLGASAAVWRWAIVPELYALWRKEICGRFPNGFHDNETLNGGWACRAAANCIVGALPKNGKHPVRRLLDQLAEVYWPSALDPGEYSNCGKLRFWLEQCVGAGLGIFDLVIIDEAHKSRDTSSGLTHLLEKVILPSGVVRRLALTATPVELDVSQWQNTLSRIGVATESLDTVNNAISLYAEAVKRVRQTWRGSEEGRLNYRKAARLFQNTLFPYLLRRDKREDPDAKRFFDYSKLPISQYRRETEIAVQIKDLSYSWRQAVCAAESLSLVTRHESDPVAKRLRLTLGNGHGISAILDQVSRGDDGEQLQETPAETDSEDSLTVAPRNNCDAKRLSRAEWWRSALKEAFKGETHSLFDHPAILKAIEAIEAETKLDEKVLVFGRFTRPLRALVDLLNAREMLRRIANNDPWPQSKVHGDPSDGTEHSEWMAVRAAHRQLQSALPLEQLDELLRANYDRHRRNREASRADLVSDIGQGLKSAHRADPVIAAIFETFKRATKSDSQSARHSLQLVSRAIAELYGDQVENPAEAFGELIAAVTDKDNADSDGEIDGDQAVELWESVRQSLDEEYNRPQGGFARLMFGGTSPESRRMIQLAFNRPHSFPRVLVAQSLVGREGLNLHKACRNVVLLHPEWNPGVVEQQIGRVDRVDSHWSKQLRNAIEREDSVDQLPRIEVRPVIFRGTYDEYNWEVLRTRWNDLRAQLHGVVIPPSEECDDDEGRRLIEEIANAAPNFSPLKEKESSSVLIVN